MQGVNTEEQGALCSSAFNVRSMSSGFRGTLAFNFFFILPIIVQEFQFQIHKSQGYLLKGTFLESDFSFLQSQSIHTNTNLDQFIKKIHNLELPVVFVSPSHCCKSPLSNSREGALARGSYGKRDASHDVVHELSCAVVASEECTSRAAEAGRRRFDQVDHKKCY